MNSLTAAAFAETALVTYRQIGAGKLAGAIPAEQPHAAPLPSTYTAIVIVYGALHFVPGRGAQVASLVGWGLVLATFLNLWNPSSATITGLPTSTPTKASSISSTPSSTATSKG